MFGCQAYPCRCLKLGVVGCTWTLQGLWAGLGVLGRAGPYVGQAMTLANGGGIDLCLSRRRGMPQRLKAKDTLTRAVQCFLQMCEDSPTPMVLSGRCC